MTDWNAIADFLKAAGRPAWADSVRANHWIPASERLPIPGKWVQAINRQGVIANARYTVEDATDPCWFTAEDSYLDDDEVTYWRPMPETP